MYQKLFDIPEKEDWRPYHRGRQGRSYGEPRHWSPKEDPKEDPTEEPDENFINEDLREDPITQKKTPKKNLSLKTLEKSLSLMVLKRSLSPARNTNFLGMVMERVGDGGKFWLIFFHITLTFFHQLILREGIFGKAALLRFLILYISCNKVTLCNSYHFNKLFLVLMMTKLCLNAILLKRQAPSQFTKGMKLVAT